jgi:PmbA protein
MSIPRRKYPTKDGLFSLGERILREMQRRGADEVMVLPSERESMMVRFSNNKVTVVQNWTMAGVDVLSVFGNRRIISRFDDTTEEGLARSLDRVSKAVPMIPESLDLARLPQGRKFADVCNRQKIIPEKISDDVSLAINSALREGAERVSGVFTASLRRDAMVGSNGAEGYDERSSFELNVRAFEDGNSGQSLSCGTKMGELGPERAGEEAGTIVHLAKRTEKWEEGRYDVLLGPIIAANLLEDIGDSCSAFSVEAGTSCLADKIGQQVLSPLIKLEDDGAGEDGLGSRSFDDEGVPTRSNLLIDRGILKTYLHNMTTAKKYNTASTGNAGWIAPGTWNLKVGAGELSIDESLHELKNGIYMVSNWYTRYQNYGTGDFSTICRDGTFLVQNGEIKGALKGARMSDNLLRVFGALKALGKERRWVRWWEVRTPTLIPQMIVADVNLTKAQES